MANSFSVYYFESPETVCPYLSFKDLIVSFGLTSPCQAHAHMVENKQKTLHIFRCTKIPKPGHENIQM